MNNDDEDQSGKEDSRGHRAELYSTLLPSMGACKTRNAEYGITEYGIKFLTHTINPCLKPRHIAAHCTHTIDLCCSLPLA